MCKTIVITTTEQANKMLKYMDEYKQRAKADNYAKERHKPIKWLNCTCCGESYQGRQWWNQDCGYGLGDCCVKRCNPTREESECYGVPGIHYLIPKAEQDDPAIVEDRGQVLHDVDPRLRIECDGYVYWRGFEIEHWSGSLLTKDDRSIAEAKELARRCEILEDRGAAINTGSVVWGWSE